MKRKLICLQVILLFFTVSIFSQKVDPNAKISDQQLAEFLADVKRRISTLKNVENRVLLSAKMASIKWLYYEKGAREIYLKVIDDFDTLVEKYEQEQTLESTKEDRVGKYLYPRYISSSEFTLKNKGKRLLSLGNALAQEVLQSDAALACDLFVSVQNRLKKKDSYFGDGDATSIQSALVSKVLREQSEKSLSVGEKLLTLGFDTSLLKFIDPIYWQNEASGVDFAGALVEVVKTESRAKKFDVNKIFSILEFAYERISHPSGKKPLIFRRRSLNEIGDTFANLILLRKNLPSYRLERYLGVVKEFSPSNFERVKQKLANDKREFDGRMDSAAKQVGAAVEKAVKAMKDSTRNEKNINPQKRLRKNLSDLFQKKLSPAQRQTFVTEAREQIEKIKTPVAKVHLMVGLAIGLHRNDQFEFASKIMTEATQYVVENPYDIYEFERNWLVALGFSEVNADKAFEVLETNTISQVNSLVDGFARVDSFFPFASLSRDGELFVFNTGKIASVPRSFEALSGLDFMVRNLARVDLSRTIKLADKFRRPELQIMARFVILERAMSSHKIETFYER